MSRNPLDGEWSDQPDDPAGADLGYDIDEWERIEATSGESDKYLFLPGDEEMLREEAFVVVAPSDLADLVNNR